MGECCANYASFSRLTNLWTAIVCPKANGQEWPKSSCLMVDCTLCGIKTLKLCPIEKIQNTKIVQWQRYGKVVVGQKDNNEDKKVTQL